MQIPAFIIEEIQKSQIEDQWIPEELRIEEVEQRLPLPSTPPKTPDIAIDDINYYL